MSNLDILMPMDQTLLNTYIRKLEDDKLNLLGVWKHGSTVYGYADELSDEDYVVVWKNEYPEKEIRLNECKKAGYKTINFADKPYKGREQFEGRNIFYNVVHLPKQYGFFELYKDIQTKEINEAQLYRLGGFLRGEIIYDPQKVLQSYRDTITVTEVLRNNYKNPKESSIKNNLDNLNIAAKRKHALEYIKCLNFLLITLHTIHYLENGQFPLPVKWFEKEVTKFNWDTPLSNIVLSLKKTLPMDDVATNLTEYINTKS